MFLWTRNLMKMEETEEKAHSYILTVYLGLFANIKINFED